MKESSCLINDERKKKKKRKNKNKKFKNFITNENSNSTRRSLNYPRIIYRQNIILVRTQSIMQIYTNAFTSEFRENKKINLKSLDHNKQINL